MPLDVAWEPPRLCVVQSIGDGKVSAGECPTPIVVQASPGDFETEVRLVMDEQVEPELSPRSDTWRFKLSSERYVGERIDGGVSASSPRGSET